MVTGAEHFDDAGEARSDAALARRLQILATEHWGLLAARSTAQNEVLTRISIYLTLVSAGLITIGLLGQATGFRSWFPVAALAILGFLTAVGLLTLIRMLTVAEEDMMFVVAMNRIRGGYADVDVAAAEYFLASTHDDFVGMAVTYSFLRHRGGTEQVLGSSLDHERPRHGLRGRDVRRRPVRRAGRGHRRGRDHRHPRGAGDRRHHRLVRRLSLQGSLADLYPAAPERGATGAMGIALGPPP